MKKNNITHSISRIFYLALFLVIINNAFAQYSHQGYYWAASEKHYWEDDSTTAIILIKNMDEWYEIAINLYNYFNLPDIVIEASDEDDAIFISYHNLHSYNKTDIIATANENSNGIYFFSYAKHLINTNAKILLRNEACIKLLPAVSINDVLPLVSYCSFDSVVYDGLGENTYSFYCSKEEDVVEISNVLYESGMTKYSTPDFYSDIGIYVNIKDITIIDLKNNSLEVISPNPANAQITVDYHLASNITTAQLQIVNLLGALQTTQTLNVNQTAVDINIGQLQAGTYTVMLVANNNISDSKNFVKQ